MNFKIIIILGLCFSLAGCDALYRLLDKEGAEEKKIVGNVIPFEKNEVVEEIQLLLQLYGYNVGEADGAFGLRTRNAIAKFQKDNGLKETRFADNATWERLHVFVNNELVVDYQLNIRLIQNILTEADCSPGKIDGKLGPKTKEAIKQFQKKSRLVIDGKIGYKTLRALSDFYEEFMIE